MWRVISNVLPTRENISSIFDISDVRCVNCGGLSISSFNLFKECPSIRALD